MGKEICSSPCHYVPVAAHKIPFIAPLTLSLSHSRSDDAGITTAVKARMAEDKTVSATSISVETLKGTVQLSGFAKSQAEKNQAENIARNTKHVREVRNSIVVRP